MTGVEQQLLSNQLLQQLVNQNQGGGLTSAVGLIGKTVPPPAPRATLQNGARDLAASAPPARRPRMNASVIDSSGNVVWTGALTPDGAGAQSFTWNGENQAGVQQPNGGTYTLTSPPTDASGATIPVTHHHPGHGHRGPAGQRPDHGHRRRRPGAAELRHRRELIATNSSTSARRRPPRTSPAFGRKDSEP